MATILIKNTAKSTKTINSKNVYELTLKTRYSRHNLSGVQFHRRSSKDKKDSIYSGLRVHYKSFCVKYRSQWHVRVVKPKCTRYNAHPISITQ